MSVESGPYFVGPGDKRPLLLGADGKSFLRVNPDGTIELVNSAAFPTLALTSPSLTTPTLTAPAFASSPTGNHVDRWAEVTITKANILAMSATPVVVVAALGVAYALQFLDACLIFDYATAQYGGGGDVTINYDGGAAVSVAVVKTNAFGAAGDKVWWFPALNAAGGYTMPVNTGLAITNATGAFTDPGTAAGVGRLKIHYRVIETGL